MGEEGAEVEAVIEMRRSLADAGSWVDSWGPGEGSCVKGRSMGSLDEEVKGVYGSELGPGGAWIKEEADFDEPAKENVDLDWGSGIMEGSRVVCARCFSSGTEVDKFMS